MRNKADKFDREYIRYKLHGGKFENLSPELKERLESNRIRLKEHPQGERKNE